MPHGYSAENHDWDMTLHAAFELFQVGKAMDQRPRTGNMSMGFSAFTGSMLLSFAAIESFSASVAFAMPQTERYANFNFDRYRKERTFSSRIDQLFSAVGQSVDRSRGLFQTISEMQRWRNLVSHASPYRVDKAEIENTMSAVHGVHKSHYSKDYLRSVDLQTASAFYQAAYDYIKLLAGLSGLEPRTQAVYRIGE